MEEIPCTTFLWVGLHGCIIPIDGSGGSREDDEQVRNLTERLRALKCSLRIALFLDEVV